MYLSRVAQVILLSLIHICNGLMPYLGTDETQQGNYQLISSGDQAGMDKYNGPVSYTHLDVYKRHSWFRWIKIG